MMPPSGSRTKSKARIKAYLGGHRGEALAAWYLRLKFYRVLARRFKTPVGEIDLIVERFGVVVFVEVKARTKAETEFETLEAINDRRIMAAADYWLARHPRRASADLRFDIIFLARGRWPRHIVNAFQAS
jgi:putative endonuclease